MGKFQFLGKRAELSIDENLNAAPDRGALSCSELQPIYEILPRLQQKVQQYRHHFEYSLMTLLGSQLIQK